MKCEICQAKTVEKKSKVNSHIFKGSLSKNVCPNKNENWHIQAVGIKRDMDLLTSPTLKKILKEEFYFIVEYEMDIKYPMRGPEMEIFVKMEGKEEVPALFGQKRKENEHIPLRRLIDHFEFEINSIWKNPTKLGCGYTGEWGKCVLQIQGQEIEIPREFYDNVVERCETRKDSDLEMKAYIRTAIRNGKSCRFNPEKMRIDYEEAVK